MTSAGDDQPSRPPLGGGDLECVLACRKVSRDTVSAIITSCGRHGFAPESQHGMLVYGADYVEPLRVVSASELEGDAHLVGCENAAHFIIRFRGVLLGTPHAMSATVDTRNNMVTLGMPEDGLWQFRGSLEDGDLARLEAFGACCTDIAESIGAVRGLLGPESTDGDDVALGESEIVDEADLSFLSQSELSKLWAWYVGEYSRRWD